MFFHDNFNGIVGILKYIFKKIFKKPKNRRFASALPDYPISPLWAKNQHVWGFLFIEKCATLEKDPTPGLTVKMKQDITATIPNSVSQPCSNLYWITELNCTFV